MAQQSQNVDSLAKVFCRSQRAVNSIIGTICSQLDQTLKQNDERSDAQRKCYMERFKEVFGATMQRNILANGQLWDTARASHTPEFESVDTGKEKCINDELIPRLDDCIVSIAKKRKHYPRSCHSAITDFSNHQAAYLSKVKPQIADSPADSVKNDMLQVLDLIKCDRLQPPSATLANLTKTTSLDYERAVQLNKAVEMQQADKDSKTAAAVFSGSPGFCDSEQSASAVKRKLALSPSTNEIPEKVLRSGVNALGIDFVVQPFTA